MTPHREPGAIVRSMPTPSEQKALAFLVFVILLGGAVRVVRAGSPVPPTAAEQQALARQTDAAESAGTRARVRKAGRGRVKVRAGDDPAAVPRDPYAGVPVSDPRRDRAGGANTFFDPRAGWINGYPPPSPRIDVGPTPGVGAPARPLPPRAGHPATSARDTMPIDLDVAGEAEIESLPRVGPATAARIVANRDSFGPFRSLEGLRRLRGMGPATLQRLAPRVTFSGRAASITAGNRLH